MLLLLLLPLLWCSTRCSADKDTYLEAFMESHAAPSTGTAAGNGAQQNQYPAANAQPQYAAANPQPQPQYGAPSPQPQYGAPSPQPQYGAPNPQPQYGAPNPQPQYGAPNPQPQYGAPSPQPQYGAPSSQYGAPMTPYGAATVTTTTTPIPFFEGLGVGLWSMLSQIPLPDFHTALKILLKVVLVKGVIKIVSLLLMMLFIPKLEDILSMVSSLMEVEMDMGLPDMDAKPDKPGKPSKPGKPGKPDHHDQDGQDEEQAGEDAVMGDEEESSSDSARSKQGAVRSRMLNALAARVEDAISRTAATVSSAPPCASSGFSSSRCGHELEHSNSPPKKVKKKATNKKPE